MEEGTALVLTLQLLALASIAAALLLYLLCRLRPPAAFRRSQHGDGGDDGGGGRALLVTCADTALGLQLSLHLAQRGFRVFAGLKEPDGSGVAASAVRAWAKSREGGAAADAETGAVEAGALVSVHLDPSREDLLHDAVDAVRGRLPAGERGLWGVLHVGGACGARGRLERQRSSQWERLLRDNVTATLRTARALAPLTGRLLLLGDAGPEGQGPGLVAFRAARAAVDGAAAALRDEISPTAVTVLRPPRDTLPEQLFALPRWREGTSGQVECRVLGEGALRAVEESLLSDRPRGSVTLPPSTAHRPLPITSCNAMRLITQCKHPHE